MRYSIRLFLVLTAIVGIALSVWVGRAVRQRAAVNKVLGAGGWVYYGENHLPLTDESSDLTFHLFQSVKLITLRPTADNPADDQLEFVAELPVIDELTIWPGQTGQTLDLNARGGITDRGVETIVTHLTHLKYLGVTAGDCSDDALEQLKNRLVRTKYIHVKLRGANRKDLLVKR